MANRAIPFKKMHGLGNDFIMMKAEDLDTIELPALQALAKKVCHRNFGIGADGLIVAGPPTDPAAFDIRFIYINSDGSIAEMCGNGIRCFARFVVDEGLITQESFRVETLAGLIQPTRQPDGLIRVNMGPPQLSPEKVPFQPENPYEAGQSSLRVSYDFDVRLWPVSMGNPHAIVFLDEAENARLVPENDGAKLETHPVFPAKTNVEFTEKVGEQTFQVVVWERGCGFTLACGTGACATAVAAILSHRAEASQPIEVQLPGGNLFIEWAGTPEAPVWMSGPAATVCEGRVLC